VHAAVLQPTLSADGGGSKLRWVNGAAKRSAPRATFPSLLCVASAQAPLQLRTARARPGHSLSPQARFQNRQHHGLPRSVSRVVGALKSR
jgi:hypothetical protein